MRKAFLLRAVHYAHAKRRQRQSCQFEALKPERDPHNGNAENKPCYCCAGGQLNAPEYDPQNVQQQGSRLFVSDYLFVKGEEPEAGKLEALKPDRYANNGDAPEKASHSAGHAKPQAEKQEP
jgi:hypothetical protein